MATIQDKAAVVAAIRPLSKLQRRIALATLALEVLDDDGPEAADDLLKRATDTLAVMHVREATSR